MSVSPELRLPQGWDFAPEAWPDRSALFGYAPEGMGTGMVVSLAGHLQDLAVAHGIPPVELLRWIADAGSLPGVPGRSRADFEAMNRELLKKPRATLVGPSRTCQVMVEAIGRLTLRDDIAATTVLAWAPVVPAKDSFKPDLDYCPCCYEEWARPANPGIPKDPSQPRRPYEPLIWQFSTLGVCSRHGVRLRSHCPNPACGARLGAIRAWARPGYCSRCGGFVGATREEIVAAEGELDDDTLDWQRFVTSALSDLIAHPPLEGEPISPLNTPAAVQLAVERVSQGNYTRFSEAVRMSLGSVSLWKDGLRRPGIKAAVRICAVAGFRLPDFLAGRLDRLEASSPPGRVPYIPPSGETHHSIDRVVVSLELEKAIHENPAPSVAAVQRALGIYDRSVRRLYPEQHGRIRERRAIWAEQNMLATQADHRRLVITAVAQLNGQGRYPGNRQVQRQLPSAISLRDEALETVWKDELVRLGYPRPEKPVRGRTERSCPLMIQRSTTGFR